MTAYMERTRKLTDLPRHGFLPVPAPRDLPPQHTSEPCPECRTGRVIHVSDNPEHVRYVCSRRCGWDA